MNDPVTDHLSLPLPGASPTLTVDFPAFTVCLAAIDAAEKTGVLLRLAELNDLGGLFLQFTGSAGQLVDAETALRAVARNFQVNPILEILQSPSPEARPLFALPPEHQPLLDQASVHLPDLHFTTSHQISSMNALGIIETQGFTALTAAIDTATKAGEVEVVAREKLGGGYIAVILEGNIAAVNAAVTAGRTVCEEYGALVAAHVIARPSDGVHRFIETARLGRTG